MRRLLAEPLLHFAVLGAALFAAYGTLNPASSDLSRIVVTTGQVGALEAQFRATRQRAPTGDERRGLIDNFVREEVLYREGLARGLDREDPVIRNRVKLRMEFLAKDTMSVEPTDAELEAYLSAHRAEFEVPGVITFEQVYVDPERHTGGGERDIAEIRATLRRGHSTRELGDPTMLPARMNDATLREVAATFGEALAGALPAVSPGEWQGPLRSAFGVHFVRVQRFDPPHMPSLAAAREVVAREWARAGTAELKEQYYQRLRQRYAVTIEASDPASPRVAGR